MCLLCVLVCWGCLADVSKDPSATDTLFRGANALDLVRPSYLFGRYLHLVQAGCQTVNSRLAGGLLGTTLRLAVGPTTRRRRRGGRGRRGSASCATTSRRVSAEELTREPWNGVAIHSYWPGSRRRTAGGGRLIIGWLLRASGGALLRTSRLNHLIRLVLV